MVVSRIACRTQCVNSCNPCLYSRKTIFHFLLFHPCALSHSSAVSFSTQQVSLATAHNPAREIKMASQAQARFDKLFQNKSKPAKPTKDGPGFAERELAEYKRRQQELGKARHQPDHDEDTDQPSDKEQASVPAVKQPTRPIKPSHRYPKSSGPGRQPDHIPGTDPEAMVFVPGGIWSGGLAATKLDTEPNHEDIEPASSSPDCIGCFCVFNLVTKFPYKYLQDPGDRVSKHFFAGGQIYQRNWDL